SAEVADDVSNLSGLANASLARSDTLRLFLVRLYGGDEVLDEDDALREHEDEALDGDTTLDEDEASDGDTVLGRDEALGKDGISDEDVILV
ncbi:2172_t:CDS:2, partial [Racocetra fulgida]